MLINRIVKRIASMALVVAMTVPFITACSEQPKEAQLVDLSVEKDLVYGEDVSSYLSAEKKGTVEAYVFSGYEKILSTEQFEGATTDISVYAAKNESESIVASLFANVAEAGLEFKIGTLPTDVTAELFIEKTHLVEGKNWPDGLLPIRIEPVDLDENELQNILIRFNVGKNAVAGDYEIPVVVTNANGEVFSTLTVDLHVWNFTYSDDYALDTAIGLGWDGNGAPVLYKEYYDFMLDQKISAYILPYDITSEEADAYMSDPRVSGFKVSGTAENYKKLKSNPEWLAKAYVYDVDEPYNKETAAKLTEVYTRVKEVAPNLNVIAPFTRNFNYDFAEKIDGFEAMAPYMDIRCAFLGCFNNSHIYKGGYETKIYEDIYGPLQERLVGFVEKYGGKVWTYTCGGTSRQYADLALDTSGLDHRIIFWQQYLVGSTGFLYWDATYWSQVEDPWTDADYTPNIYLDGGVYGDGVLLYPGDKYGINGPCGSVRFEACRDGVEDFELITMVANTLGAEKAMEFVNLVTTHVTEFTEDPETFNNARIEMGNALEAALNK